MSLRRSANIPGRALRGGDGGSARVQKPHGGPQGRPPATPKAAQTLWRAA